MTDETRIAMQVLRRELRPIDDELARLSEAVYNTVIAYDSDAIHLAACHAEWSAKRAAMIAKFFKEV